MGDRDGRVRVHGRDVSQLRGVAGRGPDYSSGCLCGGLSTAARGVARRAHQAPGQAGARAGPRDLETGSVIF